MTRTTVIPDTVTVHVPFRLIKRGGRKQMVLPIEAAGQQSTDDTMVKALARAFRWKRMLESGDVATLAELAGREKIAPSYMTRILRLTLLGPRIVEGILNGTQEKDLTLAGLMEPFPLDWDLQPNAVTKPASTASGRTATANRA